FVCEECGLSFGRAVALKVHKRLHSGDSPYGCDECTERFISRKLLAKHQATH
ncbi:Zinc finger protein 93, partial [Camponotus floridanus]